MIARGAGREPPDRLLDPVRPRVRGWRSPRTADEVGPVDGDPPGQGSAAGGRPSHLDRRGRGCRRQVERPRRRFATQVDGDSCAEKPTNGLPRRRRPSRVVVERDGRRSTARDHARLGRRSRPEPADRRSNRLRLEADRCHANRRPRPRTTHTTSSGSSQRRRRGRSSSIFEPRSASRSRRGRRYRRRARHRLRHA